MSRKDSDVGVSIFLLFDLTPRLVTHIGIETWLN